MGSYSWPVDHGLSIKERKLNLQGKVALVTGGAVRVGRAIALALAAAGCDLFLHYGNSGAAAGRTQEAALAFGNKVILHQADLSDAAQVQAIVPAAKQALGRVDILVNSAAIFLDGNMAETSLATWESQFAVNLRAPFLLCQAFAAHLPAGASGQIINITDARVFRPGADHFAYRLTKSALVTMTENLAHELAPHITVNGVALGAILPPPGAAEGYLQALAQERVPLLRPGHPTMVAENVIHLLTQPFITGTTIRLDGGQFL